MKGNKSMTKIYPDSHIEVQGLSARYYDLTLNIATAGFYDKFIKSAIAEMNIQSDEHILDLGCGTGRNARLMHDYSSDTGHITGMDISEEMGIQFEKNCASFDNVEYRNQRVDIPFTDEKPYYRVFMSFVLHGFPHEVRLKVLQNIFNNLKTGGRFCLLDFSQFQLKDMPFPYRVLFKTFECKYAFDFVERDWKQILTESGFGNFNEHFWFKKYVRLLISKKK
jgi:demethylmenaquinone methyltransferase/2-methoxy-6-polyprenyl-1,4-benzoquinol methylase